MMTLMHQVIVESRHDVTSERNYRFMNRAIWVKFLIGDSQVL